MSTTCRTLGVLVPTFRRPDDLRRCLEGLRAQTRAPDEVLVVVRTDDEATHAVLAEPAVAGLPVRVVAPDRPGFAAALWTGLAHAGGDVVAVLDDDAVALPDWLERIEQAFALPGVVAVGGLNCRIVDGEVEEHRSAQVGRLSATGRLTGMHYARSGITGQPVEHLQGCNMAFSRPWPLVDRALGGDAVYMELDLCLRAGSRGTVWYDERIAVDHYLGVRHTPAAGGTSGPVRNDLSPSTVWQASWNYAYVLSKNTAPIGQRLLRLGDLLLVGQRPMWGLVAAAVWAGRGGERREILRGLVPALAGKVSGWRAGAAARRSHDTDGWRWSAGARARPTSGPAERPGSDPA